MASAGPLRSIDELTLAHRRVLVRTDFDVPLDEAGNVLDDRKLRAALPTLRKALQEGARVVVASHLGQPGDPAQSLEPVAARLAELLGQEVFLPDECVGDAARKVVSDLRDGQLCLLENLHGAAEEARNDETFARKLLALADAYVGEAFGASPLTYASLVALPRLMKERAAGYQLQAELAAIERAGGRERPLVTILGGKNFTARLPLLEAMLRRSDAILVGGGVASTLLAARGVDVKASSYEPEQLAHGRALLVRARDAGVELVLPIDLAIGSSSQAEQAQIVSPGSIPDRMSALDIGPQTLELFRKHVARAKATLWHGALGALENPAFAAGTKGVLSGLAEAPGFGIVLGDSVAAAALSSGPEQADSIGFISTSSAAALAHLQGKPLPGISALRG